jgi:hypothetical protein
VGLLTAHPEQIDVFLGHGGSIACRDKDRLLEHLLNRVAVAVSSIRSR